MYILFEHLKKYWKLCLLTLFLAVINQVFSLLDPYIFRIVIDKYATKPELYSSTEFFEGVGILLVAIVAVAFISRVAKNFQDYYLNSVSQRVGADLYKEGVVHALGLPYSVFEDERSGETLGKLQKARSDAERLIASFVNVFFIALVGFAFVTIYAISIYWPIAIVFALTVPVLAGMSALLSRKIKKIQGEIVRETTALSGSTTESLRNIELVKSLGLTQEEVERLNTTTEKILALELKKLRYLRSLSFVQGTVVNFLRISILFFMLYLIYNGTVTFGEFFSLFMYSFFVFGPLQEIGNLINIYRETEASFANYQKLLDAKQEEKPNNPKSIGVLSKIDFRDVTFGYGAGEKNAVEKVTFSVGLGRTIAFVGPSGSGKTSIVKLLVGLYLPQGGNIHYNDVLYSDIDKNELRNQIGLVTQDTQLFAGTIKENLLFVNSKATDEDCLEVLKKAQCMDLISRGGQGLNTVIGEGGMKLSGGEKQRLSIARALLRRPKLLIFDEATSALDSLTEEEISKTIRALSILKSHMTVMVAHRLSTIMHADTIYVLEKGKIIEEGSHEALLQKNGLYSAMWREQIGERE